MAFGQRCEDAIWEAAGILGLSPDPFTLRQLLKMSHARLLSQWDQVSMIVAKVHNSACSSRKDMVTDASVFNPLRRSAKKKARIALAQMRQMYTGRKS